jgi:antitoxin (DNA-binding transcriptional repressor) of toxin-antitoxin stability system
MVRLSATEVSRSFSAVLNRVGRGEEVEVVRNGVAVAELRPAGPGALLSAARWGELMASAPAVDEDFERELEGARRAIPAPDTAWPS